MKTIQTTAQPIDIQAAKENGKDVPSFRMTAYTGGMIRVSGYEHPVGLEISGMTIDQKTPIRAEHNGWMPVGHTEKIDADSTGIFAEGLVSRENEVSKDIVDSSKKGYPWQASVGASVQKYKFIQEGQKSNLNGKEAEGPFYHITQSRLNEISFVERGADSNTMAVAAKQTQQEPEMDTNEDQKPAATPVQASTPTPAAPPVTASNGDDLAVIRAARAEQSRKTELNSIAAKALDQGADIDAVEQLLQNGLKDKTVTASQFERDMVLCQRRNADFHISKGLKEINAETVEAAIAVNAGLKDAEKEYDERTLNAAQDSFKHGLGLREAIGIYARRAGFSGQSGDIEGMLRAAFTPDVRAAGFSTINIGGILSNVANKFIREAFNFTEQEWAKIAAIASVRDFKSREVFSLTGDLTFKRVTPAGEIGHGTLGEEKYSNKAETYGRMLSITRQDLINDDLDALSRVPRKLGRGAGLTLNEIFWAAFLDDAAFFNTDKSKGNYVDGAASALSSAGLDLAEQAFAAQTDPDGNPLGSEPRYLLVPRQLKTTALELMNSSLIVSGNTAKTPNVNIWQSRFEPVASRYLTAAKVWYLLADPNDLPVIEVAFLNGQRMPMVETAQADFNTLGIQMRGVFDFGVAKQEHRAGVKVKGEA